MDAISFIPQFGGFAWTLVAFVVALSIIVFVHEYGHYIVGRWSGIHAEVFSLGFGPILFSRVDRRGTRWQIAALPFGGYVKFLGDSNAASAKADDSVMAELTPEQRRATMHGAPLWARAATVAAGPAFNFAMSIVVFAGFFLWMGVPVDRPVVGTLQPTPFAGASLEAGDTITALNGTATPDFETFGSVADSLPPAPSVDYTVLRDGAERVVAGPFPLMPMASFVQPQSAAAAAGLEPGDVILSVDGQGIDSFRQLRDIVGASEGKPLDLTVWRGGETFDATLTPKRMDLPLADGGFETRWLIGLSGGLVFEPEVRVPGPLESLDLAVGATWNIATTSLSALWHVVTGAISTCNLQGPIGIAETSGHAASAGLSNFIWFIAMLSTAVGLMNLFPVPVLDGGHLVFHIYEATTGRPPSDRVLRVLMAAGAAAILGLMLFALSNDIFCP